MENTFICWRAAWSGRAGKPHDRVASVAVKTMAKRRSSWRNLALLTFTRRECLFLHCMAGSRHALHACLLSMPFCNFSACARKAPAGSARRGLAQVSAACGQICKPCSTSAMSGRQVSTRPKPGTCCARSQGRKKDGQADIDIIKIFSASGQVAIKHADAHGRQYMVRVSGLARD